MLELQVEKLFDKLMFQFVRLERIMEIDGTSGHKNINTFTTQMEKLKFASIVKLMYVHFSITNKFSVNII